MPGAIFSNFSISSLKNFFCISKPFAFVTEHDGLVTGVVSNNKTSQNRDLTSEHGN
jgi:hypothetical protein